MKREIFDTCEALETVIRSMPHHDAEALTEGGRKAIISLGQQIYTLQITKQGKLLLTK